MSLNPYVWKKGTLFGSHLGFCNLTEHTSPRPSPFVWASSSLHWGVRYIIIASPCLQALATKLSTWHIFLGCRKLKDIASNNTHFMDTRKVQIKDIRGDVDKFTLDQHGFVYVSHKLAKDQVSSEESIKTEHYPENIPANCMIN